MKVTEWPLFFQSQRQIMSPSTWKQKNSSNYTPPPPPPPDTSPLDLVFLVFLSTLAEPCTSSNTKLTKIVEKQLYYCIVYLYIKILANVITGNFQCFTVDSVHVIHRHQRNAVLKSSVCVHQGVHYSQVS